MTELVATLVRDPVCGMTFPPETAKATSQHHGETIYFCSPGCKQKFDADPDRYLHSAEQAHDRHQPAPQPPGAAAAEWTCPMHPEIVRGSRAMPQIGQLPGASRTISGCIGHVYSIFVAGAAETGSKAMPHFGQLPGPCWRTSGCIGHVYSRSDIEGACG